MQFLHLNPQIIFLLHTPQLATLNVLDQLVNKINSNTCTINQKNKKKNKIKIYRCSRIRFGDLHIFLESDESLVNRLTVLEKRLGL